MIINTMHFGEVEIDETKIIHFEEGLPGFEELRDFVVINDTEKETPFKWLQSVEQTFPAFPILSPFEVKEDYEIDIDKTTEELLEIKDPNDVVLYTIVVIPEDVSKMSANLRAPIVVNAANGKGRQMILENSPYDVKYYILEEILKAALAQGQEEK